MLREIAHFVGHAPECLSLQKKHTRAEFAEIFNDRADEQGFAEVRRELVSGLSGRVLEIGCGTGAMFRHYPGGVEIDAIEPEDDFRAFSEAKPEARAGRVRVAAGDGMSLAFADGSFDAVVLGLVLCSVPSVERVTREAFRVLRKGGELRALEHVRSEGPLSGRLMDATNWFWLGLNKQGCNWNRDPLPPLWAAGFVVDDVLAFQRFDTWLPAFPMRRIRARKET